MLKHNNEYLGTVAHDKIKPIPKDKNSHQIINLHKSSQPGSHFVCYHHDVNKNFIYYFVFIFRGKKKGNKKKKKSKRKS